MQCCAPRSKPLTRVFGPPRAGAVPVDAIGEADHVGDSTRLGAGQLKGKLKASALAHDGRPKS